MQRNHSTLRSMSKRTRIKEVSQKIREIRSLIEEVKRSHRDISVVNDLESELFKLEEALRKHNEIVQIYNWLWKGTRNGFKQINGIN